VARPKIPFALPVNGVRLVLRRSNPDVIPLCERGDEGTDAWACQPVVAAISDRVAPPDRRIILQYLCPLAAIRRGLGFAWWDWWPTFSLKALICSGAVGFVDVAASAFGGAAVVALGWVLGR
jgi:hypothetical protein